MDSLLFALKAVTPIILMVAIGYFLKRIGLMSMDFSKAANKLVFRVFLPVTLFLNVYKIENFGGIDFGYIAYALIAIFALFLLAIPVSILVTRERARRGPLVQVTFRSNYALVGLPLAASLFGEEGMLVATLLSAFSIPLYNVLAVISLSVFRDGGDKPNVKKILLGIVKNPLILSIAAGLVALAVRALLVKNGISFRLTQITPLYTVMEYLSDMSTPLALLVLGAQFEFSAIKALRREIIVGTLARTVVAPLLGVGVAYLFFRNTFNGAHFAAFVALFATPVAVSSLPMAQEMDNDAALAGQYVVWTTLASALSIFLCAFLLRLAGIFV
ncbi:MAG: AEC family transporter [Clostridia bacterium]|nr:AEC family transporter [Clostridia bacterium]